MTELEKKILAAMSKLLEESSVPEIQDPEPEIIAESMERKQKKRDSQHNRESRRLFR